MVTAVRFSITPTGAAVLQATAPTPPTPVKFDEAFIERRMREHRPAQERTAAELEYDIIRELVNAMERGQ